MLNPSRNVLQIQQARRESDIVLVFVHGGPEFHSSPSPRMVSICRAFAEAGASAVICHHAHSIMGMEIHNSVPIAYNLGNFLFDRPAINDSSLWRLGILLKLDFQGQELTSIQPIPVHLLKETGCVDLLDSKIANQFSKHFELLSNILTDSNKIEYYWKIHCALQFPRYLTGNLISVIRILPTLFGNFLLGLDFKCSVLSGEAMKGLASLRTLFVCENHIEVIGTALEMIRTSTFMIYRKQIKKLEVLEFNID